ncbi:MAG: hypothetical protein LBB79_10255 [Prevotellaceae bacterium]|nr:hypothetical protein [Prevotellaceae bacterium]
MALFVAIGAVAGVIKDKHTPKIYRSEAIIRSNNLAINIVVGNLEKLNNLCELKNYHELSSLLNISEADAEKISSISAYYGLLTYASYLRDNEQPAHYAKKYVWDDTAIIVSKFVKIVVEVFDESVYASLTPGLLHFISNNTFGHKVNLLRVEQLKSQIAYVEREIATLSQIQTNCASKPNASVQLELSGTLQKSEQVQLHEATNKLYTLKAELEREHTLFTQPATVIADFSKTYRPVVGLLGHIAVASGVTVVLGLVALLLWDNRKKRRRLRKK